MFNQSSLSHFLWRSSYHLAPFIVLLLLTLYRPSLGSKLFGAAGHRLGRIARRRGRAILFVGIVAFALSATLALFVRTPQPSAHDEFAYLLAADTFARGRLTNPPHELWMHFESMHILVQPTYMAKYPPAQGLLLAAGQVLGGRPMVGLWLSAGLTSAAICWMLMGWLPARWALIGGLLAALHPLMIDWNQSYWGGAAAAGGGALLLGAYRRLCVPRPRVRDALVMGLGLAVLANSRPFEGMVLSLLVGLALLRWMLGRHSPEFAVSLKRIALPVCLVLGATFALMGYYNLRITGDALKMPYMLHEDRYAVAPAFLFLKPRPVPEYRHEAIRDSHVGFELGGYESQQTARGFLSEIEAKLRTLLVAGFVRPPALGLPLVVIPWVFFRDRKVRFAALVCLGFVLAVLSETWFHPHYAAPIFSLFLLLALQCMRRLAVWRWRGRPVGGSLVGGVLALCVLAVILTAVDQSRMDTDERGWALRRARILEGLEKTGGRHLVVVRYAPGHPQHREWVYNSADIDGSKVVWVREMDAAQNERLVNYFGDRRVWLLEPDGREPELAPYPR